MNGFRMHLFGLLVLAASVCQASTVFSNLGPPSTDYVALGYTVGGTFNPGFGFSPSSTVTLTSIDVVLTKGEATTGGAVTIGLYNAETPWSTSVGSLLESWTVPYASLPPYSNVYTEGVTNLTSTGSVTLSHGTHYWLTASADEPTRVEWALALSSAPLGPYENPGSLLFLNAWQGAFDVSGSADIPPGSTPEPSCLILFGSGLLLMAGVRRARKSA